MYVEEPVSVAPACEAVRLIPSLPPFGPDSVVSECADMFPAEVIVLVCT
jgi:hypothetical protein